METDTIMETDNLSDVEEHEPLQDDNSEIEVPQDDESGENGNEENSEDLILGKFKTDEDVRNAYKELEAKTTKLAQEKSELAEKAQLAETLKMQQEELAKLYGFQSVDEWNGYKQELQFNKQLAEFTANEYAKCLKDVEYPDDVKSLLLQYQQNPTKELLEEIEAEFPLEQIKQVSESVALYKGQLASQFQQAQTQQERTNLENYLKETIEKHKEAFNDTAVTALFGEAFKQIGAFDADTFFSLIQGVQQSAINNYLASQQIQKENIEAQNTIEGLSPSKITASPDEKNILDMSPEEMLKEVRKYK